MGEGPEAAGARVVAWPRGLRWVAAALVAGAGAAVLQLGVRLTLDAVDGGMRASPRAVLLGVLAGVLLPMALVELLRRFYAARLLLEGDRLRLAARSVALELRRGEVARVHPWLLPLPAPGEWWELSGGGRLTRELVGAALGREALGAADRGVRSARAFAEARRVLHRRGVAALAFKYGLFPLLPAGVLLRAYQHITFGGWNGEYQLFGLGAWLDSALQYWGGTLAHLVVIGGTLRVVAELCCLAAAWAAPSCARGVRWSAEWLCRGVYYAGIPALLALRFLA